MVQALHTSLLHSTAFAVLAAQLDNDCATVCESRLQFGWEHSRPRIVRLWASDQNCAWARKDGVFVKLRKNTQTVEHSARLVQKFPNVQPACLLRRLSTLSLWASTTLQTSSCIFLTISAFFTVNTDRLVSNKIVKSTFLMFISLSFLAFLSHRIGGVFTVMLFFVHKLPFVQIILRFATLLISALRLPRASE